MECRIAKSIGEFSPEEWDSVSPDQVYSAMHYHTASSHRWLSFMERNARFYNVIYILISDESGPFARLTATELGPNSTALQRVIARKALLLLAPFSAGGGGVVFRRDVGLEDGLHAIDPVLRQLCARDGRLLMAVANVSEQERDVFERHDFIVASAPSNTFIEVPATYDEYLERLSRKGRNELRRMHRRAEERGVTFKSSASLKERSAELYDLFCEVYTEHGVGRDKVDFSEQIFADLEDTFADDVTLFEAHVDGRLAGYLITLRVADRLGILFAGLHYELARPTYAYFLLYEFIIKWAMEAEIKVMGGGFTLVAQKERIGFRREKQFLCYRANSRLLHKALRPLNAALEKYVVNAWISDE